MASGRCGRRLLELDVATISRIQFGRQYVVCMVTGQWSALYARWAACCKHREKLSGRCGRRLLELDVATISRIQFGRQYVVCMVTGQWSTLYARWAACCKHREKYETSVYIHECCTHLGMMEAWNSTNHGPQQPFSSKVKLFRRHQLSIMLSQEYFGRPTRVPRQGFQCKTHLSHRWSGSNAE